MLRNSGTVAVAKDMEQIMRTLGEDKLNHLGYSYGTILGATFAAIRPDLVKRMVLDGVSDSESYFNDILQFGRDGMQDTHKVISGFITTCVEAGPLRLLADLERGDGSLLHAALFAGVYYQSTPKPYDQERYTGSWKVKKGLKKTGFPILFVSLDADPVTPLPSAVKMSKGFGNESASLLVQQG
ncbi:hypothetical protein RSAG8_09960, partial [Rhizoctonia solani AG-8 WAC10335]